MTMPQSNLETQVADFAIPECLDLLNRLTGLLEQLEVHTVEHYTFEVGVRAIEQRYRMNAHRTGLILSLSGLVIQGTSLLFDALGYYALLTPDLTLTGNEPLPFAAERQLLCELSALALPDERELKDLLQAELI